MKKRTKVKKVVPYNERERNAKVLNLVLQVSELGMSTTLTPEIRKKMDAFVNKGENYTDCIDLPKFSRQMIIQLINDKHQQTFINFKYIDSEQECCDNNCDNNCTKENCN